MSAAGVPVRVPRSAQEPFHTTLGVVDPSACPFDELLATLTANFTSFSPQGVLIDAFDMIVPPVSVLAYNNTSPPLAKPLHHRRRLRFD